MTSPRRRRPDSGITRFAAPLVAAFALGCEPEYVAVYYPPYSPGYYPATCSGGVSDGSVDTGALLDLDPGRGVGTTVEVLSDGSWRFASACDSLISGTYCAWSIVVTPIDGVIDGFEPEELDGEDILEAFDDGVVLDAVTTDAIDAFVVFATPGAGMRVDATIDGFCAGPYVFWTEDGDVRHSTTNPTDLFPTDSEGSGGEGGSGPD
jgi:hypothetical protein